MAIDLTRRAVVAGAGAAVAMPWVMRTSMAASAPILLGIPSSQTATAGTADHIDHLHATTLAVEEINAAGGIHGRELKMFVVDVDVLSPESVKQAMAACIDAKVHAISCAFTFVPIVSMDATVKYKCPFINGDAQRAGTSAVKANPEKYSNCFQIDPSEFNYGWTYALWLEAEEKRGVWKPKNRKVHVIQEQVAYCQNISKAAQEAIKRSGKFEVARVTDIQYPVQDWTPVLREMHETDAAAIFVDHWVAAEFAAFAKQFVADPVKDSLVYMQYGPSQPEFLTLAGSASDGFCWATTYGVYPDKLGLEFQARLQKRFPVKHGIVQTAVGYDIAHILKKAWEAVGDPNNFKAVCDWIRANPQRGVAGFGDMNNAYQESKHFPNTGFDELQAAEIEKGVATVFAQVQNGEHKVIYPTEIAETKLARCSWWS